MQNTRAAETKELAALLVSIAFDGSNDPAVSLSALSMATAAVARGCGMTLEQYSVASDRTAEVIYKQPMHSNLN